MPELHYLSLGAGVQSSTLALMAAEGEVGPMPAGAIFADTQQEPASVYRWLDWLESRLPFPLHRVTAGDLGAEALAIRVSKKGQRYYRTAIPFFTKGEDGSKGRIGHRSCTRDFKIRPILQEVRRLVGRPAMKAWRARHADDLKAWREHQAYVVAYRKAEKSGGPFPAHVPYPRGEWEAMQADALATQWIGISTDEVERVKPSRDPWVASRWPLIELRMSRQKCLDWMEARGYPRPPRSACVFCPFHSNAEWRRLKEHEPEAWAAAVAFDEEARRVRSGTNLASEAYLHRSLVPLAEADIRSDEQKGQLTLWSMECEGMCGV